MEIHQKHSKRKIILITLAVIIALGISFVGVYVGALKKSIFGWPQEYAQTEHLESNGVNMNEPTSNEKAAGDEAKSDTVKKDQEASPTPSTTPIQVTLTASGRNGDIYQVRYLLDNSISEGTCKLALKKGAQVVTQEAAVQVLGGSTTCAGFNVPYSSLSSGQWQATLTVTSGDRTGTSTDTLSL